MTDTETKVEHEHNAWTCPAHCHGCGCADPANSLCNPYYTDGYCPDALNWMPGDEPT